MAIVFEVSVSRSIDPDVVWARKYDLCALAREKLPEDTYTIFDAAISKVTSSYSQYIQPGFDSSAIEELCGVTCFVGQRTSRIINKVCRHFGVDLLPDYNAKFAELADALNPLSLSRTAALSVHPCDYLEMSNTRNSWSSCHNLEDGCYRAGTLSYLAEVDSLVFTDATSYAGEVTLNGEWLNVAFAQADASATQELVIDHAFLDSIGTNTSKLVFTLNNLSGEDVEYLVLFDYENMDYYFDEASGTLAANGSATVSVENLFAFTWSRYGKLERIIIRFGSRGDPARTVQLGGFYVYGV